MLSPRIRRLKLDYEQLQQRLAGSPVIRMVGTAGLPPELYRFQYLLRGLYVAADGSILERDEHLLEVNLSLGYPRRAPQCRMLTPVFHPNFDDSSVCIGDFWAASEGLDDLIIRIGRMIAYQEYNTKSPLNGLAAKWAAQNAQLLPVDPRPIAPPLAQPLPQPSSAESQQQTMEAPPVISDAVATELPKVAAEFRAAESATAPSPQAQADPTILTEDNLADSPSADPWTQKIVIR